MPPPTRRQILDAADIAERIICYRALMTRTPAVSYGMSHDGDTVLLGAAGFADVSERRPAEGTTAYRIASISKTFTATLVLQLVERGAVRLDEPVTTYLPWTRRVLGGSGVTVRHLLTHSGGIVRDGSCAWDPTSFPTAARLHADLVDEGVVAEAAAGFRYSNVAYALLGEVIERAGGAAYAQAVQRRIARPLGLSDTSARLTARARRALATGYERVRPGEDARPVEHSEARAFEPAGGLTSTVPDLLAYEEAHFPGDTRLVSDLTKREMQRVQWERSEPPHHGLGWMIYPVDGITVRGHSGGYPGFVTRIGFSPELRLATAALTNTVGPLAAAAIELMFHCVSGVQALWEEASSPRSPGNDGTPSRPALSRYVGQYRDGFSEILVGRVNRTLYLIDPDDDRPLRIPARLEPAGTHRFLVAERADYGNRGEHVSFEVGERGPAAALVVGAERRGRADP